MSADDYTRSMNYEMLIRNAFDCPSGMQYGAHQRFMQKAMTMKRGETSAKHLGSFEKQFQKVKSYTSKALLKLAKKKPYSTESDIFNNLNNKIDYINSTDELMEIVELAMEKIVELKKF